MRYSALGIQTIKIINHENTKSKKNEMFRAIFRGFVLWFFRDEKMTIEHPTSDIEIGCRPIFNRKRPKPEDRGRRLSGIRGTENG